MMEDESQAQMEEERLRAELDGIADVSFCDICNDYSPGTLYTYHAFLLNYPLSTLADHESHVFVCSNCQKDGF